MSLSRDKKQVIKTMYKMGITDREYYNHILSPDYQTKYVKREAKKIDREIERVKKQYLPNIPKKIYETKG